MRDAFNLAWKLAMVVKDQAGDALLNTYQQERRDHAKAMIDLSVTAGHVLAPPYRWQGKVRDGLSWVFNYLPPIKRYFLEMRFKPMPQYNAGALVVSQEKNSPVGRMFIQPKVTFSNGIQRLLDEAIGPQFAIIAWGSNPQWGLSAEQIVQWQQAGTQFIQVVPEVQLSALRQLPPGVVCVGDTTGQLKAWFANQQCSIVVLRPDRFVAAVAIPQTLGRLMNELAMAVSLRCALNTPMIKNKVA